MTSPEPGTIDSDCRADAPPIRILVDDSAAFHQGAGIGRYAREVVPAAAAALPFARWTLLHAPDRPGPAPFDAATRDAFAREEGPATIDGRSGRVRVRRVPLSRRRLDQFWYRVRIPLPAQVFGGRADVVYSPDFTAPPAGGTPRVVTVHDLAFLIHPDLAPAPLRRYLGAVVPRQVAGAARVVAVSETTRRDLVERLGVPLERLAVVPNGVEPRFFGATSPDAALRARLGLPEAYLLCVGTIEPRKDHRTLFRAVAALGARLDMPLVVAGRRGWEFAPILAAAEPLRRVGRVLFLDYVPDADLPSLYAGAAATVYPSRYEGFGLPVLESLAAGVPTVTSDAPALREVGGEAIVAAAAGDVAALADAIVRALGPDQRTGAAREARQARARLWDWDSAGRALAEALRDATCSAVTPATVPRRNAP